MKRAAVIALLAIAVCGQSAVADPTPPSPVGDWTFQSDRMSGGCTLGGDMMVTRKKDRTLSCRFTARWACESGPMRAVDTDQTCTARQTGHDIEITSRIEKVTRSDPADLMDYMRANYAADHFKVRITPRGDEMRGLFHSYGQAEVIFRRKLELLS